MGLVRPTRWAEVDLGAIRGNLAAVRSTLPASLKVCAVVKADAYGHGAIPVARAALVAGADWLAVATPTEGLELSRDGIAAPILVMGPTPADEMADAVAAGLRLCVYDRGTIEAIAAVAAAAGTVARLHLKVDTGMARLGCAPGGEAVELARLVDRERSLELEGFWTHLAEADDVASPRTAEQVRVFATEAERLDRAGIVPRMLHCASSAGALLHPAARFDMVRCGLPLYGYASAAGEPVAGQLRPAMTWKARVVAQHELAAGDRVGYGGTFVATRPTRVATISIGYGDGYSRRLSGRGEVLLGGHRAPLVGRVSMDFITVDVSALDGVDVGDEAVLMGCQGPACLAADEVAGWLDTIPWEVLCQVGRRVPRVYRDA